MNPEHIPHKPKNSIQVPDLLGRDLKCKKCYGRGYIGDRLVNKLGQKERVYCKCVPWIKIDKAGEKYKELELMMRVFHCIALIENLVEFQKSKKVC